MIQVNVTLENLDRTIELLQQLRDSAKAVKELEQKSQAVTVLCDGRNIGVAVETAIRGAIRDTSAKPQ